jgi:hypothetical protein
MEKEPSIDNIELSLDEYEMALNLGLEDYIDYE